LTVEAAAVTSNLSSADAFREVGTSEAAEGAFAILADSTSIAHICGTLRVAIALGASVRWSGFDVTSRAHRLSWSTRRRLGQIVRIAIFVSVIGSSSLDRGRSILGHGRCSSEKSHRESNE